MHPEVMNTRLIKMNRYRVGDLTGIARLCDLFIHDYQCLNITGTNTPLTIFISNYRGYYSFRYFYTYLFRKLTRPYVLIIASEDCTFPRGHLDLRANHFRHLQKEIAEVLNSPLVKHVFVENLDTLGPKLSPLPLGLLQYHNWNMYAHLIAESEPIDLSTRPICVMACHRHRSGPQWEDRKRVSQYSITAWKEFVEHANELDDAKFKQKLTQSQFCICVHGGGVDPSPRAWEALLCGTIPILERSSLDAAYSRFPVAYVDAWTSDAITTEKLDRWLEELRPYYEDPEKRATVLSMLTLDYWWAQIQQKVNDAPPP